MPDQAIKNVHTEHCCAIHGCKYNDNDCPVANRVLQQSFPCQDCADDARDGVGWSFEKVFPKIQKPAIMPCTVCTKYKRLEQMTSFQRGEGEKLLYDSTPEGHIYREGLIWICRSCIETIKLV